MTDSTDTGPIDLQALAEELLDRARSGNAGRAARTLPHPVDGLRHTVIALTSGTALDEHESPGSATLLVLRGRVRLMAGDDGTDLGENRISPIPASRHSVQAHEDSVLLLSVAHSHAKH